MSLAGPRVYADWVPLFGRFARGDDSALDEMQRGTLALSNLDAQRWLRAVSSSLKRRLALLSHSLRERVDGAVASGEISAVLGWTRSQLVPLYRFSCLQALPPAARTHVDDECRRWIKRTQTWLERTVARVHDQGLMVLTVRRSPLRWPPATPALTQFQQNQPPVAYESARRSQRRVLGLPNG